jgi:hypothetical protein
MESKGEKQNVSSRPKKIPDRLLGVVEIPAAVQRGITDQQNPRGRPHMVRHITV